MFPLNQFNGNQFFLYSCTMSKFLTIIRNLTNVNYALIRTIGGTIMFLVGVWRYASIDNGNHALCRTIWVTDHDRSVTSRVLTMTELEKIKQELRFGRGRRCRSEQEGEPAQMITMTHLWRYHGRNPWCKKRTSAPQMGAQPLSRSLRNVLVLRSRRSWPVAPMYARR